MRPDDLVQLVADESRALHGSAHLALAAQIQLLTSNAYGTPNVAQLDVVSAQKQGVNDVNDMYVQLHLAQTQRLVYGGGQPRVTSIVVQLNYTAEIGRARARLTRCYVECPEAMRSIFATLNPQYRQITDMFNARGIRFYRDLDRDRRDVHGRQHHEYGRHGAHMGNRNAARNWSARYGRASDFRVRRIFARAVWRRHRHIDCARGGRIHQSRGLALGSARPDGQRR
ncbi:hypothetical protein BPMI_00794 [Candidatus Burkholderia pumila]|uniref:Uncharacterized protein n=1 Tax=Candidatus Burkholderia pumila TaxID=1090375 RepID=A0ABR5HL16_9BURK|nr:hypothetical protein BPMI_00794 [Candidatus Burkholderia pumila]